MSRLGQMVTNFLLENPGASAQTVADACNCSKATARAHAKRAGVQLAHGNKVTRDAPAAPPAGHLQKVVADMVEAAMRGPMIAPVVREIVEQWLAIKAPVAVPTDDQVKAALLGPNAAEILSRALAVQGYAGIYSALHRNHSEIVRRALHTPVELHDNRSDHSPEALGNRFAMILGDPRGDVMMNAFFAALGGPGRKVFGDAVRKIVAGMNEEKAGD